MPTHSEQRCKPTLGLCCIETRFVEAAIRAVQRTLACVDATVLYWFGTVPFPAPTGGVPVVSTIIRPFDNFLADHAKLCLTIIPQVADTDVLLMVQADGFAVNGDAWDPAFLDYDYIGATWPWMWGGGLRPSQPIVGNGGFSLRSRRLHDALLTLRPEWRFSPHRDDPRMKRSEYGAPYMERSDAIPEDVVIGLWYRDTLERDFGIRFCPPDLANKFSVEAAYHPFCSAWLGRSFGFHGRSAAPYYGVDLA